MRSRPIEGSDHLTIKERVLASRLIEKMESHESYIKQIGLSGQIVATGSHVAATKAVKPKEKNN